MSTPGKLYLICGKMAAGKSVLAGTVFGLRYRERSSLDVRISVFRLFNERPPSSSPVR